MSKYGRIYLGEELVSKPAEGTITITENGTVDVAAYDEAIVNVPISGEESDVNFYDYDGALICSYTASQFANLSALPVGTTHPGLVSQGWNWTLSDAKTYVSNNGGLDIGANYRTDDGTTRLYITIDEPNTEFMVSWIQVPTSGAYTTIDWGDSSATTTNSDSSTNTMVNATHTYTAAGDYMISMTVTGTMTLYYLWLSDGLVQHSDESRYQYQKSLRKVELGLDVTCIGGYAYASNLESISVPSTAIYDCSPQYHESAGGIDSNFDGCSKLNTVVLPYNCTTMSNSVGISNGRFQNCVSLKHVLFPLMTTCTGFSYIVYGCSSLERIYFTGSTTSINYGCGNCFSLKKVVIPYKSVSSSTFQGTNIFKTDATSDGYTGTSWSIPVCIYSYNPAAPTIFSDEFGTASYFKGTICVPSASVNTYKNATNWSTYSSRIVAIGNEPLAY